MKTLGRITATLALLLALYVLGYWVLIKKDWLQKLPFVSPDDPFNMSQPRKGIYQAFKPLAELDQFLHVEVPLRKYLTGDWRSNTSTDFVTLDPNQVCRFQLGKFASEGKVQYGGNFWGLWMEFEHHGQIHIFTFRGDPFHAHLRSTDLAYASVQVWTNLSSPDPSDYHTTLTKQSPSIPAP